MAQRKRSKRRRELSRRQFLAESAAAGVALGLPGLLVGCGDDGGEPAQGATPSATATPTPTPTPRPREQRTLHFDLSFAAIVEPRLRVLFSDHDGLTLTPHSAETRMRFRAENPLLEAVADERLTHFAEAVDLPADSLQQFWVTGREGMTGESALLALQIHVPQAVRRTLAAQARLTGQSRVHGAKVRAYGLGATADGLTLEDLAPALDEFVTPWDTAAALVFHCPEIMNVNVEQGPAILDLIQTLPCATNDMTCMPFLSTLAFRIATHGPATTKPGGWATLTPVVDPDTGMPLLDENGETIYQPNLADETVAAAQQTIRGVLSGIFNDPRFEGTNWHALQGRTVSTPAPATRVQGSGFELVAEHPPGTNAHGLDIVELRVTDAANRKVEMQVRNWHLRTFAVHVEFANEGMSLPVQDPQVTDTARSKYVELVATANTIAGIPAPFGVTTLNFSVPKEASKAILHFGSLGVGGDPFCPEAVLGSIMTITFDLAIPLAALITGIKLELAQIFQDAQTIARAIAVFIRDVLIASLPGLARGIFGTAASGDAGRFLAGLLNVGAQLLLRLAALILSQLANPKLTAGLAAGFAFGIAAKLWAALATAAELAQTVVEVLANPALFDNTLSLVMDTTVRILHDPDGFQFPARARHWEITLVYDMASKVAHKQSGDIKRGRVDSIEWVFRGVPSGGKVTVDVVLTTEEGYIIGRSLDASGHEGPYGPIDNLPDPVDDPNKPPPTPKTIEVTIKEHLIPLTEATHYLHDVELKAEHGERVWVQGPAPTATRAALCQGQDDRLCTLGGITMNQRTGMAGYSFSAGGQGNRPYCGETSGGVMHLFQNLFLADDPQRGLKVLPCGFRHPAGIVYERLAPANGPHFFFEPAPDGQSYFLESVVLDTTTPFGLNNPLTWGRFTQALESVAVVPTGFVVGVSRQNHKMEILALPRFEVFRKVAPEAVPFAVIKSGEGTREGLLSAPVAVAVRDATILVLENGNARIQAFDVSANPVPVFRNGTSATVELEKSAELEYLDLAVEGLGYMYVLSATHGGLAVEDYRLDVFTPQGNLLARTTGVAAARLAVDTFRNVYTLNYASVAGLPRVEPSLSQWVPSTPEQ